MWRKDVYFLHPDLLQRESRRFQAGPGIPDILEGPVLKGCTSKTNKAAAETRDFLKDFRAHTSELVHERSFASVYLHLKVSLNPIEAILKHPQRGNTHFIN